MCDNIRICRLKLALLSYGCDIEMLTHDHSLDSHLTLLHKCSRYIAAGVTKRAPKNTAITEVNVSRQKNTLETLLMSACS
jgi:hypothetical protein